MRVSWIRIALLTLVMPALTAMQTPAGQGPPPGGHGRDNDRRLGDVDAISFGISSWGTPLESFEIARDGSGSFTGQQQAAIRFNAGPEGFERIRIVLQSAERYASEEIPCGSRATDFPYGGVSWRTGATSVTMHFDIGCLTPEMRRVEELMREATTLAEGFARDRPVR